MFFSVDSQIKLCYFVGHSSLKVLGMALSQVRREEIEEHLKDVPNEEKEEVAALMSKIITHEAYGKPYVTSI